MTLRGVLLKTHLSLGLAAGLVLFVLGLTGTIIAFENDSPRWLHSDLFYVRPGPTALPEHDLVRIVEQRFAPARVGAMQILRRANLAHVAQLPGGVSVFVNQYTGAILVRSVQQDFADGTFTGIQPVRECLVDHAHRRRVVDVYRLEHLPPDVGVDVSRFRTGVVQ